MPRAVTKGTWDEKTRTLTFRDTDEAGNKALSHHKFIDKDHSEWTFVITSPTGTVLLDMNGKCTRRKGPAPAVKGPVQTPAPPGLEPQR